MRIFVGDDDQVVGAIGIDLDTLEFASRDLVLEKNVEFGIGKALALNKTPDLDRLPPRASETLRPFTDYNTRCLRLRLHLHLRLYSVLQSSVSSPRSTISSNSAGAGAGAPQPQIA